MSEKNIRWNIRDLRIYVLTRDQDHKATVVVLPSGKCVVEWPASVIV